MDQLNIHSPARLYHALPPQEGQRLADRLERHDTPKHRSWLNLAEIALSALSRQGLSRRRAQRDTLQRDIEQWERKRNSDGATINWHFTTQDARIKLRRRYPSLQR